MKKILFLAAVLIPTISFGVQKIPATQITILNEHDTPVTLQDFAISLRTIPASKIIIDTNMQQATEDDDPLIYPIDHPQSVQEFVNSLDINSFPLTENADFANYAATNVSYIQLVGSTNQLTTDNNKLLFGGEEISAGNGFPLTENADFANHAATNVSYLQLVGSTKQLTVEDEILKYGGEEIGSGGSLNTVWGPVDYSDQQTYVYGSEVSSLGIVPDPTNANFRLKYDPINSVYYLQAFSAIPGPRGADGFANLIWAGTYFDGMIISNDNTLVTWDGSLWTRNPDENPIHIEPGTEGDTNWVIVVSRGNDGIKGKDGVDGVGLQFVDWSTNLTVLTTNMLISYDSYLLMITNTVDITNPGQPVVEKVVDKHYKVIVRPGSDGGRIDVYTNMSFIVEFDPNTSVPAHSLVVYHNYLWYAKQDYIPNTDNPPPTEGPFWMCIGDKGLQGAAGLNGVGNLKYAGAWDQFRTNNLNDIVRYKRADGRYDWYRAIQGPFVGFQPDLSPDQWSKEITSGVDANVIEWTFVDGNYDYTREHVNELYRDSSGKVYYSVGVVPAGLSYKPGMDTRGFWRLFVKDGTSIAGDNGVVWRGEWERSYNYEPGDMVTWDSGNGARGLYINKVACNGPTPSNTDYWIPAAIGMKGDKGIDGKDGEVTNIFVTNITTYAHADIITNIYNVTNDKTTAIANINDREEIYNHVSFNDSHFSWNDIQKTFSLTESALGVSSINTIKGNVIIQGQDNINVSQVDNIITVSSTGHGLLYIPLNITSDSSIDTLAVMTNSDCLIFDGTSGFSIITNNQHQLVITADMVNGDAEKKIVTHSNVSKPYPYTIDLSESDKQYFTYSGSGSGTKTLIIPSAKPEKIGHLTLYISVVPANSFYYDISSSNIQSFPSVRYWLNSTHTATWKIEFESVPGSSKWYYISATEYVLD